MPISRCVLAGVALTFCLSSSAFAQATASIAGVIRDASGAVLPGVTVEAASPALIEKTRTVVTDGGGLYKIEQLRGGVYTVTFSLSGFNTLRRDGIELSGSFAATVNAELKVGSIAETVTVTGESPLVDIQTASKQRVIDQELLVAIPTGRTPQVAAFLIPGVNLSNVDVGGTNIINTTGGSLSVHGGSMRRHPAADRRRDDCEHRGHRLVRQHAAEHGQHAGGRGRLLVGHGREHHRRTQINMIPKTGGNRYSGSLFATGGQLLVPGQQHRRQTWSRAGCATPNSLKHQSDVNPGFGGPLKRDTLWFYTSARFTRQANYVGGLFQNKNAGDITKWTYEPDPDQRAFSNATEQSVNLRLTWQAAAKHKLNFFYDQHWRCQCGITSPTVRRRRRTTSSIRSAICDRSAYTATPTNRLLFEARFGMRREEYAYTPTNTIDPQRLLIPVIEQQGLIPGLLYRGGGISTATQPYQRTLGVSIPFGASLSYVPGGHSFKFGFYNVTAQRTSNVGDNVAHLTYQFLNGTPNQLTQRATPLYRAERQRMDLGVFAQDKWTLERLTLSYGVRFDHFSSYFPEQTLEPGLLVPTRNLTFPAAPMASWYDVVPRVGSAYDLFGDGKTALRVSINKYVIAQGLQGTYGDTANPGESSGQHRDPQLDRRQRQLRPRLRSDQCRWRRISARAAAICAATVSDTNFGTLDAEPQLRSARS